MKVEMIMTFFSDGRSLEKEINKWLEKNQDKKALDIKVVNRKIAMVIYEEN